MAKQLQKMFGRSEGSGPGMPRGTSLGLKLLGTAAVIGIGINQSMYTGEPSRCADNRAYIIKCGL